MAGVPWLPGISLIPVWRFSRAQKTKLRSCASVHGAELRSQKHEVWSGCILGCHLTPRLIGKLGCCVSCSTLSGFLRTLSAVLSLLLSAPLRVAVRVSCSPCSAHFGGTSPSQTRLFHSLCGTENRHKVLFWLPHTTEGPPGAVCCPPSCSSPLQCHFGAVRVWFEGQD